MAFIMAGTFKVSLPKEKLKEKIGGWVEDFASGQIKTIGTLEILGGLGMVLPMSVLNMDILTPLAALGLILTMIGAMSVHLKRGEKKELVPNILLLILAAFVVIGRF